MRWERSGWRDSYLGAIRALAMALDARDPHTAGHSERVSALPVAIGRRMGLADRELKVLRLGALLHDIGTIGVSDNVFRKPAALTPDEYELIKTHPTVGVPFRVDAGIMPSPVGLFTLDPQPHRNPLISAPFYYFSPLPPADGGESANPRIH